MERGSRPDRAQRLAGELVRPLAWNGELVRSGDPRWLEAMEAAELEHSPLLDVERAR